jgi:hypothetical protein
VSIELEKNGALSMAIYLLAASLLISMLALGLSIVVAIRDSLSRVAALRRSLAVHSPQVANMPTAAAAMTAVASQPRLFSHGLRVN